MKRLLASVAAACALTAAGCGTPSHHAILRQQAAPVTLASPAPAAACDPGNYSMGCALTPPPPSAFTLAPGARGIDFGWSCPVSSAANFGASYESYDASKDWTRACVNAFHRAGKATVVVWETAATRATQGYAAGRSDAVQAARQAAALGEPSDRPIFFAIDCDCAGRSVAGYFDGVRSVLPLHRIGAYGGVRAIAYLFDTRRIAYGWQTYAWSAGSWDARAKLQQYLNGSQIDYDRATAADYGQWPYAAATPARPRVVCFGRHASQSRHCAQVRSQAASWQRAAASSRRAAQATGRRLAPLQAAERTFLARERYFAARVAAAVRASS